MKLLILLFFVLVTPLAVLFSTLLYGSINAETLKKSLSETKIYTTISEYITESAETDDQETKELVTYVESRFSAEYIQHKTELAIEDSYDWVTGNSTIPPVVSFSELKDDLLEQNPQLLEELESMSAELKATEMTPESINGSASDVNQEEIDTQLNDAMSGFSTIINQDFSFKLEPYLTPFKGFFSFAKILLPVLGFLLLGSLILLGFLCGDWKLRFKWIGSTLMVAGLVGFGLVVFNNLVIKIVTGTMNQEEKGMVTMFGPVIAQVVKSILEANSNFQLITSITLFIIAAGFFIAASLIKKQHIDVTTTKFSKKK